MLPGRAEHVRPLAPRDATLAAERDPARAPGASASARRSSCSRCCAPGGCRSGPMLDASSSAASRALVGVAARLRRVERHRRAAPGDPRRGHRGRRRGRSRRRSRFVASANVDALRGRAAGLRRHRPGHAEHRTRGGRGGGHRAHDRPAAGPHLRLPGRHGRLRARWPPTAGSGSSRTPARRSARVHADGTPVGARGNLAVFAFYANKQLTTGEGGMVVCADAGGQGAHRLRAQPGPRARHGLARPRPARLQLPALRRRVRARHRPARAARRDAGRRAQRVAGAVRRGARRHRGRRAARRDRRGRPPLAGSSTWSSCPHGVDRDGDDRGAARARASTRSPTCRRST